MIDAFGRYEERCAKLGVPVYWSTGVVEPSMDRRDFLACRDVESIAILLRLAQTEGGVVDEQSAVVDLLLVYSESLRQSGSQARSETIVSSAAALESAINEKSSALPHIDALITACGEADYEIRPEQQIP
jgi:hypothetical protein